MELKERLENYLKEGKQDAREILCEISEKYGLGLTTKVEIHDTDEIIDNYVLKNVFMNVIKEDGFCDVQLIKPFIVKIVDGLNWNELLKINCIQNAFFCDYLLKYQQQFLFDFLNRNENLNIPKQDVIAFDKSNYEPFTFEDAELFRDRWVVAEVGEYPGVYKAGQYNKESVIYFKWTYAIAFDILKFEDGSPFGKLKK